MATWLNNMFPGQLPAEGGSVSSPPDYAGLLQSVQNSPAAMNVVNNNPQVKALYDQYSGTPTPAPDRQATVASALSLMKPPANPDDTTSPQRLPTVF